MTDIRDKVRRDLIPFADPGTTLEEVSSGRQITLTWRSRSDLHEAIFSVAEDGDISVFYCNQTISYVTFLSRISDMLGLARTILQLRSAPFFVSTQAKLDKESSETNDYSLSTEHPAIELLQSRIAADKAEATRVVFVTGDAGAGKTEVLKQLVRTQAERYLKGETTFLYLYVNAQGRALARLDEALATEIQDLRASKITYHVIPSLTRNGIMVPLIDGFDELLGVLGYEDAFSSLRRFLDDLNGQGTLIASARSTYYQQEFIARSGRTFATNQRVEVEQISIMPWEAAQFEEFLTKKFSITPSPRMPLEQFRTDMRQAFSADESADLKTKPFFISKIADLILSGFQIDRKDLVDRLVEGYIERERTEKLLDKNGSPLLSADQIQAFIQMVSEEMWITETRALHSESLRLLSELAFPASVLTGDSSFIIRERAPTMAFFSPASGRDRVEFEHDILFSYFLGDTIKRDFENGGNAFHRCLSRAQLPDFAPRFAANKMIVAEISVSRILDACAVVSEKYSSRPSQVQENCGALVVAVFRTASDRGQEIKAYCIKSLVFAGASWYGLTIEGCTFVNIIFRRCDFSQGKFLSCSADGTSFFDSTFDLDSTLFQVDGVNPDVDVYGLRVRRHDRLEQVFRREGIRDVLLKCGVPIVVPPREPSISADASDLLERVLRKFDRSTLFWPNDNDSQQIIVSPLWDDIENIFLRSKVLSRESIAHQGTPRPALRRNYLPSQIMEGEDGRSFVSDSVSRFWDEMRDKFPPLPAANT